jgi:hypothetical protein
MNKKNKKNRSNPEEILGIITFILSIVVMLITLLSKSDLAPLPKWSLAVGTISVLWSFSVLSCLPTAARNTHALMLTFIAFYAVGICLLIIGIISVL